MYVLGYYTKTTGATLSTQCEAVSAGYYRSIDSNVVSACPVGTYGYHEGAISIDACINCPSGTYNSHAGATSCTLCPEGTYTASEGKLWSYIL
jgi:ferredoxin-like protein FixX